MFELPIAMTAFRVIRTADTSSVIRIARIGVSVTHAPLTIRIIPRTRLTLIAYSTVRLSSTLTLAGINVAKIVRRTHAMTIASYGKIDK